MSSGFVVCHIYLLTDSFSLTTGLIVSFSSGVTVVWSCCQCGAFAGPFFILYCAFYCLSLCLFSLFIFPSLFSFFPFFLSCPFLFFFHSFILSFSFCALFLSFLSYPFLFFSLLSFFLFSLFVFISLCPGERLIVRESDHG